MGPLVKGETHSSRKQQNAGTQSKGKTINDRKLSDNGNHNTSCGVYMVVDQCPLMVCNSSHHLKHQLEALMRYLISSMYEKWGVDTLLNASDATSTR